MCPFVEENTEDINYEEASPSRIHLERGMVSEFFKNDRKYLFIGGTAVAVVLIALISIINSSMAPVNVEELPVIQAERTPIKEKPVGNKFVQHQDKVIYDNISGDHRQVTEKIVSPPETILSIPEVDVAESLSDEDKQTIIQAFDELAPEKEYKINYIEQHPAIDRRMAEENYGSLSASENETLKRLKAKKKLSAQERQQLNFLTQKLTNSYKSEMAFDQARPPINHIENSRPAKKKRARLKDLVANKTRKTKLAEDVTRSSKGTIMVQIASVSSKAAAESEYSRLVYKNHFLRGKGKKIYKVDLGPSKGIKYRIQVGPFRNKEEARKIVSAMRDNGCAAYISK